MANIPARPPYARIPPQDFTEVNRELQKIEREQAGTYQSVLVTHALSPYTVKGTDWLILVDATAGAVTVTFPAAARIDGAHTTVIKADASANAVTLSGTFSGQVNPTLTTQYAEIVIDAANGVYYAGGASLPSPLVVSGGINSQITHTSCPNGVATTVATLTASESAWLILANIANLAGNTAVSIVGCDGTNFSTMASLVTNAGLLVISFAAPNVQVKQVDGGTQTVDTTILQIH